MALSLKERHERCLYPCVRIRTPKALGSGTVIYMEERDGMHHIYVLTNEHVVDNLIKVEKKWSTLLKREVPTDVLGHPMVEFFTYAYTSRDVGSRGLQADIVAYDKDEDLALLQIISPDPQKYVANLLPEEDINHLISFMDVWTVGCGMGEKPVITKGFLSAFGCDIDNKDYLMVTAPSIFGNSGGATFLEESGYMIGVPARIAVVPLGFSADVVTHLGFAITVARIYQFLRDQVFDFIINPERTSEECAEERRRRRERDEERRKFEEERGE